MNIIKINLHDLVADVEQKKGRRSYQEISSLMNGRLSRQVVRATLKNPNLQRMDINSIGAWLDYFEAEGMPVTIADLFTVERAS